MSPRIRARVRARNRHRERMRQFTTMASKIRKSMMSLSYPASLVSGPYIISHGYSP